MCACSSIRLPIWPCQTTSVNIQRCVRWWLMRPMRAWKPLPQVWHQRVGGVLMEFSARAFLALRFSLAALNRWTSQWRAPLWIMLRQAGLSDAAFSHVRNKLQNSLPKLRQSLIFIHLKTLHSLLYFRLSVVSAENGGTSDSRKYVRVRRLNFAWLRLFF